MSQVRTGRAQGTGLPPLTSGKHSRFLDKLVVIATFGGLLFGYDTGVISGAMLHVTEEFHINEERFGSAAHNITEIITSSILLGAVLGALGTSVIVKRVGRRKAIIGIAAVFAIGVLLSGAANDWWTLSLARVFLGLAVGGSTMAIPTYISELAPPAKRGSYVTFFNVAIGVGILSIFFGLALNRLASVPVVVRRSSVV
mgnify:CR=1 FL=1